MCAGAILQSRVKGVVWGSRNTLLGADGSWVRYVLLDPGLHLLEMYFLKDQTDAFLFKLGSSPLCGELSDPALENIALICSFFHMAYPNRPESSPVNLMRKLRVVR